VTSWAACRPFASSAATAHWSSTTPSTAPPAGRSAFSRKTPTSDSSPVATAFQNNLIAFRVSEVRQIVNTGPGTAPETFQFTGNHWHALDTPAHTQRLLRLPSKETDGIYDQPPGFKDAEKGDLRIPDRQLEDSGVRAQK
jgi:hypothetical protein